MNTAAHAGLGFACILENLNPVLNLNPLKNSSFGSVITFCRLRKAETVFHGFKLVDLTPTIRHLRRKKFNTSCKFMGNMYWTVFCQGPVTSWCLLWLPGNRSWQGEVGHITTSASSVFVRIKQTRPLVSCRGVCKCVFPLEPQLFHPVSCTDMSVASTSSAEFASRTGESFLWRTVPHVTTRVSTLLQKPFLATFVENSVRSFQILDKELIGLQNIDVICTRLLLWLWCITNEDVGLFNLEKRLLASPECFLYCSLLI